MMEEKEIIGKVSKLIDTDAKAYGVYLTLLYLRFLKYIRHLSDNEFFEKYGYTRTRIIPIKIDKFEEQKKNLTISVLRPIEREIEEIANSAEEFAKIIIEYYNVDRTKELYKILNKLEKHYYNKFRDACYKYFDQDLISKLPDEEKTLLKRIILEIKNHPSEKTPCGSVYKELDYEFMHNCCYPGLENWDMLPQYARSLLKSKFDKLISIMIRSGILLFGGCVIPAPFLENEFINQLESLVVMRNQISTNDDKVILAKIMDRIDNTLCNLSKYEYPDIFEKFIEISEKISEIAQEGGRIWWKAYIDDNKTNFEKIKYNLEQIGMLIDELTSDIREILVEKFRTLPKPFRPPNILEQVIIQIEDKIEPPCKYANQILENSSDAKIELKIIYNKTIWSSKIINALVESIFECEKIKDKIKDWKRVDEKEDQIIFELLFREDIDYVIR